MSKQGASPAVWWLAASLLFAGAHAAVAAVIDGFTFLPAPIEKRGKLQTIGSDASYGYTYLHEDGWYQATLPPGGRTDPTGQPGARTFDIYTNQGVQVCSASARRAPPGLTFPQLQARASQLLASWESDISGAMTVRERGLLPFKDTGQKHPVMASWTGLDSRGRNLTLGVVEVPRGLLTIGCTGATPAQSKFLVQMVFQLAEGAL